MNSDIRIKNVNIFKVNTHCRTPLKFGAVVVDELPIAYAKVTVENRKGKTATGWGVMFLMDLWAWPISKATHSVKSKVMGELIDIYAKLLNDYKEFAHPIEIFMETKKDLERLNTEVCEKLTPGEVMPFLGALICASPIDHAIHDAFGNVNEIDSYLGYGPEYMSFDLSQYLGNHFKRVYPSQFLRQRYLPEIPIFHLVGGLDLLHKDEVTQDFPRDGIPNSLDEWIRRDGIFCLKVKLRGRVRNRVRRDLPGHPFMSVDTNEQCQSPEYIIEYLNKVKEKEIDVFNEILYIEQPTERNLKAHSWNMGEITKLKPVIIDESLTSVEDFKLAREYGWSGIALKSCKCLSSDYTYN